MTDNERIARVLGWTWRKWENVGDHSGERFLVAPYNKYLNARTVLAEESDPLWYIPANATPDFTEWRYFPELQEYVRDQPPHVWCAISRAIMVETPLPPEFCDPTNVTAKFMLSALTHATPTILRDAILAVVGEEVEA